jgi:hypothetical protein
LDVLIWRNSKNPKSYDQTEGKRQRMRERERRREREGKKVWVLQLGEIFKTPKITNSKREGEREKGKKPRL